MTPAISSAIFFVEALAHMQGKEQELLPIADAARHEHARLLVVEQRLRDLVLALDSTDWSNWQSTAGFQDKLDAARTMIDAARTMIDPAINGGK